MSQVLFNVSDCLVQVFSWKTMHGIKAIPVDILKQPYNDNSVKVDDESVNRIFLMIFLTARVSVE
jgi:hypothetical protein